MRHLLLLRHAKSSWDFPELADFDRPLNGRGLKAAKMMARHLSEIEIRPDIIISSNAQRTRETLSALLHEYDHSFETKLTRHIYESSYLSLLEEVKRIPKQIECAMIIGHNPGMEDLAFTLCNEGNAEAVTLMQEKFPTAACAHVTFEGDSWEDVGRGKGFLQSFVRPRDLG